MNFLKGVRQKLSNVGDDISKTFRTRKDEKPKQVSIDDCSFLGGAQLLEKYQNDWFSIHDGNDHIIKTAIKIDGAIGNLHAFVTVRKTQYTRMAAVVQEELPRLEADLDAILGALANLTGALERSEAALARLEDDIEWCELRRKEADLSSSWLVARRRSDSLVEAARVNKAREHAERVERSERRRQAEQRERSATFEEEFYRDLEFFKAHGRVERTVSHTSASEDQLAAIEVTEDADVEALNEFLCEENASDKKADTAKPERTEGSGDETETPEMLPEAANVETGASN